MTRITRAFVGAALASLIVVSLLHWAALAGNMRTWAAMVALGLLGWATGMIFAVSYHVMPIFLARDFPPRTPMRGHLILFALACICLPVALIADPHPGAVPLAYALHGLSGGWFLVNVFHLIRGGVPRAVGLTPTPFPEQRAIDRAAIHATRLAPLSLIGAPLLMAAVYTRQIPGTWHLAGEHWLVLGWLMPMIMGVAYHILPRFSQIALRSARTVQLQLGLYAAAIPLIVVGLGSSRPTLFTIGAAAGGVSILLFLWNILPTLTKFRAIQATIHQIEIRGEAP